MVEVYQIKMKADKMIPIPLVMYRIMRKYIEREHIRPKDYIFKGKDGGAYRGTTFRQEFQQYCDKNGIADGSYIFKTHDYSIRWPPNFMMRMFLYRQSEII